MLNFNRGSDRPPDLHDPRNVGKPALRPAAIYEPPGSIASAAGARALPPDPGAPRENHPGVARTESTRATPQPPANVAPAPAPEIGSKLHVGVNIKLKGVEITDCDLLVVEGHVEATVHSKEMHIAQPGVLTGTALIDVAEVHGEFTGELTARTRLVVHGTGKVSGTIRYGRLIVADGGTISGDMRQVDAAQPAAPPVAQAAAQHAAPHATQPAVSHPAPSARAAAHAAAHEGRHSTTARGSGAGER